jgi:hypothetical protein
MIASPDDVGLRRLVFDHLQLDFGRITGTT